MKTYIIIFVATKFKSFYQVIFVINVSNLQFIYEYEIKCNNTLRSIIEFYYLSLRIDILHWLSIITYLSHIESQIIWVFIQTNIL